jgi:hypothetical protein
MIKVRMCLDTPEWIYLVLLQIENACLYQVGVEDRSPALQRFLGALCELRQLTCDSQLMEFIRPGNPYWFCVDLTGGLSELIERAEAALTSDFLFNSAGKIKSGRGKAPSPTDFCPRTLCAAIVWEFWCRLRPAGSHAPSNLELAAAAAELFRASGGDPPKGWGSNPLAGWKTYFKRMNDPRYESHRLELRRELMYSDPLRAFST